ncbi:histidine phosphatase family protein [Altererythrobacter sp. ZODW24]|uniref:SixA phosphatase family protein n=1 Tax=Altererythrobacter sp. ZODW24 TaxID=2185142 RepID=UPI000DF730D0|nr:histidine phosphatase family protein [Altererythrobacter sp. ZODW24]
MKTLGLLRHAKSDWDDIAKRDFDRGLNGRGRRGAALMGGHIAAHGVVWERTIASSAERVKQTLAEALPDAEIEWDKRAYLASSATLIELLRELGGDEQAIMLAGHNPGLQDLIFDIVPPSAENALFDEAAGKFPTATFAVLELDIDTWEELAGDCGKLVHLKRPRDLDPELGPES